MNLFATPVDGQNLLFVIQTPFGSFSPGERPFHGLETVGLLVEQQPQTGMFSLVGFAGEGSITFTQTGTRAGDQVAGSFLGRLAAP